MATIDGKEVIFSKTPREIAQQGIDVLTGLRDNYSNEVPEEIIQSISSNSNYKVRVGWWATLDLRLFALNKVGLLPQEIQLEYASTMETWRHAIRETGRTRAEDIQQANSLIGRVVNYLQERIPSL